MNITTSEFFKARRMVLKGAGVAALIGLGVIPFDVPQALAAANDKYPEDAFKQKTEADAIKALYGKTAEPSDKVKMDAPEIGTTLADVTSISFLVSENPISLVASYRIPAGTLPTIANRIKMAKTSNVTVIVEAGGKLYSAKKEIKVTVGGCGG